MVVDFWTTLWTQDLLLLKKWHNMAINEYEEFVQERRSLVEANSDKYYQKCDIFSSCGETIVAARAAQERAWPEEWPGRQRASLRRRNTRGVMPKWRRNWWAKALGWVKPQS